MTEVLSNRLTHEVIPIYDSDEYGRDHGVAREPMFLMLLACGEAASDQIRLAQDRDLSANVRTQCALSARCESSGKGSVRH